MKVPYAIFFLAFIAVCPARGATVEESAGTIRLFAAGCQKEYARLMSRDDLSGDACKAAFRGRLMRATNWALGKLFSGFSPLTTEEFSTFNEQIEAIPTDGASQAFFKIFLTEVIEGITNLSGDDDDGTDSAGSAGSVTVHMGAAASFYDPASGRMQFDVRMPTVDDQQRVSLRSAARAVMAANRVAAAASIEG